MSSKDGPCRSHLGSFGIGGDLALQAMYTLSGGQKSRVALAKITFTQPHILLLDEPSNHLDLDAVQALIKVRNFAHMFNRACGLMNGLASTVIVLSGACVSICCQL